MFYEISDKGKLEEILKQNKNKKVEDFMKKEEFTIEEIKKLKNTLPDDFPFFKILDIITFVKPKTHESSKEFKELTEQLKNERDNRIYKDMIKEVDPSQKFGKIDLINDFGKELKEVNRQGIAIFNTLITVGGSFVFGFFGITFMYPGLNLSFGVRLIIGLVIATIVFFADLYFIIKGMDGKEVKKKAKNSVKKGLKKVEETERKTLNIKELKED
uniref:DUF2335 domain-containing protein n=1 Tax=Parastrongyloides trichosuri TaxID=131310 RepID=A0A0N5A1E1_PARTI